MVEILLVEDDASIAEVVLDALKSAPGGDYAVTHAADLASATASATIRGGTCDLIILDWELPDGSGLEFCKRLRDTHYAGKIIMLTGRSSVGDRVTGLDGGADDYLTKPFSPVELLSRIKALSRRGSHLQTGRLSARHITFDPASRQVCKDGLPIDLFEREVQILELFIKNPGRVISQDELLSRAWPTDSETSAEAVRVAIYRLRSKIEHENDERPLIATIRGFGYRLDI
jgi:DNA-binding response OmpR family regulator